MANEGPLVHDGAMTTAAANLSSNQFYAVQISAAGQVNLETTGGKAIYGLLQGKPTSGQVCDVGIMGISKAVAGAVVTGGNPLMTDTAGRLIPQTTTNHIVAYALQGASATGVIFTVALAGTPGGQTVT